MQINTRKREKPLAIRYVLPRSFGRHTCVTVKAVRATESLSGIEEIYGTPYLRTMFIAHAENELILLAC